MSGVDVWRVDLDALPGLDPAFLPTDERELASRLLEPGVRRRWIAARTGLRRILAAYLGEEAMQIELRLGERGKPALAEPDPRLHFNLSHSGGLALIAVSREHEVGIDVEEEAGDRDFPRLAEIGLDAEAAAAIRTTPPADRASAFYAAWVRREAIAKCFGTGLAAPGPTQPVSVLEIDAGPGHAAAVAVAAVAQAAVATDAMLPSCQTRPPGKVARLGAGKALALLSSAAASSARTSSPS